MAALVWMPAPRADPSALIRNNGSSANRVNLVILGRRLHSRGDRRRQVRQRRRAVRAGHVPARTLPRVPELLQRGAHRHAECRIRRRSPGTGSQVFKNTAFDATYNCSSIQRLICVNTSKVNAAIANSGIVGNARDAVVVIVNDTEYGGSGGSIAVASLNGAVIELVLHEMGHSFGQLTDEYGGPPPPSCSGVEPSGVNATRQTVRELIKWNAWIAPETPVPTSGTVNGEPGLYQGAAYCDTGAYRPTYNSKMRSLNQGFHQINSEQHIKRIYNFVSPIDDSSPAGTVIAAGASQAFAVWIPQPFTHNLEVTWRVDGAVQASGTTYTASGFGPGDHTVTATVVDPTSMVRNNPAGLLLEVRTWTINFAIASPTITLQPVSRTIVEGFGTTFTAAATAAVTPTWRWQVSVRWRGDVGRISRTAPPTAASRRPPWSSPASPRPPAASATAAPPPTREGRRLRTPLSSRSTRLERTCCRTAISATGLTNWQLFELPDITWNINGGVMEFYRASTPATASGQATVFQHTGVEIGAGGAVQARFDLGNSSSVRKRISVLILDSDFTDLSVCTFWLPPGTPAADVSA